MDSDIAKSTRERVEELFKSAPDEVRMLLAEVLRLEQQQIHMKRPRGLAADIVDITERLIK